LRMFIRSEKFKMHKRSTRVQSSCSCDSLADHSLSLPGGEAPCRDWQLLH
jgi:hypothetical protein